MSAVRAVEDIIQFLADAGCKVPVLFYHGDLVLTREQNFLLMRLKKKYLMLFTTDSITEVENFCKMDRLITG